MAQADLNFDCPRVLLAEDDFAIALMLTYNLEARGLTVLMADDGPSAIDLLALRPALVILDWELPHLSGIEVLRRLRHVTTTPVIMLTGRSGLDDRARALRAGADAYIVKPFALCALMAEVERLLATSASEGTMPGRIVAEAGGTR